MIFCNNQYSFKSYFLNSKKLKNELKINACLGKQKSICSRLNSIIDFLVDKNKDSNNNKSTKYSISKETECKEITNKKIKYNSSKY